MILCTYARSLDHSCVDWDLKGGSKSGLGAIHFGWTFHCYLISRSIWRVEKVSTGDFSLEYFGNENSTSKLAGICDF